MEGLEFGQDGTGPDQAVACRRAGLGFEAAADGKDGSFQFRWDAVGDVVVGSGQVVQAVGAELEVASPPLVEPALGAAEGSADVRDGSAAEAERDGSLAGVEIVDHGDLQIAAAGGCVWGSL